MPKISLLSKISADYRQRATLSTHATKKGDIQYIFTAQGLSHSFSSLNKLHSYLSKQRNIDTWEIQDLSDSSLRTSSSSEAIQKIIYKHKTLGEIETFHSERELNRVLSKETDGAWKVIFVKDVTLSHSPVIPSNARDLPDDHYIIDQSGWFSAEYKKYSLSQEKEFLAALIDKESQQAKSINWNSWGIGLLSATAQIRTSFDSQNTYSFSLLSVAAMLAYPETSLAQVIQPTITNAIIDLNATQAGRTTFINAGGLETHVSYIPDLNGDNLTELVIGVPNAVFHENRTDAGSVYLIWSNASLSSVVNLTEWNDHPALGIRFDGAWQDNSGSSVTFVPDLDGDNKSELLIGAKGDAKCFIYLVWSKKISLLISSNTILIDLLDTSDAPQLGTRFYGVLSEKAGYSVSAVPDINGDKKSELLIGALSASPQNNKANAGSTYLIWGNASFPQVVNLTQWNETITPWGIRFDGAMAGDNSGSVVNYIPDLNNDTIPELLIGAPRTRDSAGSIYLIFGNKSLPRIVDLALWENSSLGIRFDGTNITYDERCGYSVSSIPDINGDNKSELLIGSPGRASGHGSAYLIWGSVDLNNNVVSFAEWDGRLGIRFDGGMGSYLGSSVNFIPDLNGDNAPELLIGAPTNQNAGSTYLVFGKNFFDIEDLSKWSTKPLGIRFDGAMNGDQSGFSVTGVPNFTRDGRPAILIGTYAGKVHLILSDSLGISASATTTTKTSLSNTTVQTTSTSASGITTTPPTTTTTRSNSFNNIIDLANLTAEQGIVFKGAESKDYTGISVSGAENQNPLNGQGFLIGAPGDAGVSSGDRSRGKVYRIFNSNRLQQFIDLNDSSNNGIWVLNGQEGDHIGNSVALLASERGNHKANLLIGANLANQAKGTTYIIYSNKIEPPCASSRCDADYLSDASTWSLRFIDNRLRNLGYTVSKAGDIDADGAEDYLIHAPGDFESIGGKTYLVYNKNMSGLINLETSASISFSIVQDATNMDQLRSEFDNNRGKYVNYVGDVNNDTKPDFIIGAPRYNNNKGKGYLIYGNDKLPGFISLLNFSESLGIQIIWGDGDYLGVSASTAGDVNGDKITDFLISAPGFGNSQGIIFLIYGKSSSFPLSTPNLNGFNPSLGIKIIGEVSSQLSFVSPGGDFDQDGLADFLVAAPNAPYNKEPRPSAGRTYLLWGSNSKNRKTEIDLRGLSSSQGIIFIGANAYDHSGCSVSSGDVDNDGVPDVIIGAYNASFGDRISAGAVYVVYGKYIRSLISPATSSTSTPTSIPSTTTPSVPTPTMSPIDSLANTTTVTNFTEISDTASSQSSNLGLILGVTGAVGVCISLSSLLTCCFWKHKKHKRIQGLIEKMEAMQRDSNSNSHEDLKRIEEIEAQLDLEEKKVC